MNDLSAPLVSTGWLSRHLADANIRVLDASWYLAGSARNPEAEYVLGHIPGAVFCDLDRISEQRSSLPHMLPSAAQFARDAGSLGVDDETMVIVYDTSGTNLSAPRVWWMFRFFGHENVAVLDGGLGKWRSEDRALERGTVTVSPRVFTARPRPDMVRSLEDMKDNLVAAGEQVLDARSKGRFEGTEPEPRPGLRAGHIPGSRNLPFSSLVGPDGTLLGAEELRARFRESGITLDQPVVTTCGSGTTACALLLAMHVLGAKRTALYDGSWSEWGAV